MKIILKHILRNIKEKKGRSLLIIMSLLIASCVFILNLTIPNQIVELTKNKTRNLIGETDIIINTDDLFNIADVKLNKEEIKYVPVNQIDTIYNDKTIMMYGTDIKKANELKLVSEITNLNNNEVIINQTTADKFNLKENDIMKINLFDTDYELKVVKILESKGLLYFKSYCLVMNNETFTDISQIEKDKYMTYYIDVEDNSKIEDYAKYVKDNNENYFATKLMDEDLIKEETSYSSMILLLIFIMAVIMIFFVINTLNKLIIIERTPVIGTFRSVGATKTRMNLILVLENAMYGLFGGIAGAVMSVALNQYCVKLLMGGDVLTTGVEVKFSNMLMGIGFAILLEVLMSIGAIIKSSKYSIKEIMFDGQGSKYEMSKKSVGFGFILIIMSAILYFTTGDRNTIIDVLKLICFWIGIACSMPGIMLVLSNVLCVVSKKIGNGSLILASKNLGHNKMIISSSRLIVISIAVILVIFNVSATFDKMLNSFSYQFGDYDLFIRDTSEKRAVYDDLINMDEITKVDDVFTYNDEDVTYNSGKKFETTPIILGMSSSRPDIEELDYKISDLKDDEMLIDSVFADENNISVGDKIKLKIFKDKDEREYKVVGTVNSFYYSIQREIIVISENEFVQNITDIPTQVAVSIKDDSNIKDVIDKIEKKLNEPDVVLMTVDEFVESQRNNIHTIMSLFYVIIGLAVALVFVGIINNQIISFIERTKELAVLNSVCMSKGQLIKMLIVENITSNAVACVIGFVVSVISVILIGSVLNGIKLYVDLTFNYSLALIIIGIVLLVLFLTVIIPILKLRKINIVEAIKYE